MPERKTGHRGIFSLARARKAGFTTVIAADEGHAELDESRIVNKDSSKSVHIFICPVTGLPCILARPAGDNVKDNALVLDALNAKGKPPTKAASLTARTEEALSSFTASAMVMHRRPPTSGRQLRFHQLHQASGHLRADTLVNVINQRRPSYFDPVRTVPPNEGTGGP